MEHPSIITLTTDFGTSDYFVAAMKGVILAINPNARIVDLTHDTPPRDIQHAAFTLFAAYKSFQKRTIHVAVVDPGVGSSRLPLVVETGEQFFIGPDNGLFSYVCDKETAWRAFQLTNEEYFQHPVSNTFHGRDIFAPVAAALSLGTAPEAFGPAVSDLIRLESLEPARKKLGKLKARIIHIDHFGNCVTSLTQEHLGDGPFALEVNGKQVTALRQFFADDSEPDAKLFAIVGSAGFVEIAARDASAAKMLKAKRGQPVVLSFTPAAKS